MPAVVKVAPAEPDDVVGMSAGAPTATLNVTLCCVAKFQVTIPPAAMSTELGENVLLSVALTLALLANALVTVNTLGNDPTVTPPAVADTVMLVVPVATPVTSPVLLMVALAGTDEFHVSEAAIALPF